MELLHSSDRATVRKSLPLSARDVEDISQMRSSITHRAALARLAGTEVTDQTSEAGFLHAVLEAGIRAVQEQAEEEGYAHMAAESETSERRAVARRRRPSWADE